MALPINEARQALAEVRASADEAERALDKVNVEVAYVGGDPSLPIALTKEQLEGVRATINSRIEIAKAASAKLGAIAATAALDPLPVEEVK